MDLIRLIRDKMKKERLLFVYRGVVTNENSSSLLMLLEKEMESSDFGFVGRKRLFMFVLESLQNVSRHSTGNQHANMSLVVFSKTANSYTVTTGNVISASERDSLKLRLDEINNLLTKDIRNVYRQMLCTAEFSDKGGAGLGLIEMAKKTGSKLDYDFIPLDNNYSYFILSKTVDPGGSGIHPEIDEKPFQGKEFSQLEKLLAENNIYMIWSGHVSSEIGKEVLSFTETTLAEEDIELNMRKGIFSILVEMLENVVKFGPGTEYEEQFGMPVTMLRMENNVYSLTTGNLIANENIACFREKIDKVNEYDKAGLKELFRLSLSEQTANSDSTGNMGLIYMAKKSGSKLIYKFEEINDIYSYFTLTVNIEDEDA